MKLLLTKEEYENYKEGCIDYLKECFGEDLTEEQVRDQIMENIYDNGLYDLDLTLKVEGE